MPMRRTLFRAGRIFARQSWIFRSGSGLLAAAIFVLGGFGSFVFAEVGKGAAALLEPEIATRLQLTEAQTEQIQMTHRATSKRYKETLNAGQGRPGLKAELERIREEGHEQAVSLLKPRQKRIWNQLANSAVVAPPAATPPPPPSTLAPPRSSAPVDRSDEIAAKSLIIPTIGQLRHPPSPNAYGPNTKILQTHEHAPRGDRYVILTDYPGKKALAD